MSQTLVDNRGTLKDRADLTTCIRNGRAAVLTLYDASAKTTKNPGAKAALKAYIVAFVATLEAVPRALSESAKEYESRQATADRRLSEAWAAYQLETR